MNSTCFGEVMLSYLSESISNSDVSQFVIENPNFHDPCEMDSVKFFAPLRAGLLPDEDLSGFCFISSNLISQSSCGNDFSEINVYCALLYLYAYSFVCEGVVLVSLAVRICLKITCLESSVDLPASFVSLFEFCLEHEDSFDDEAAFFLKAGILFLQDRKRFRAFIDSNREQIENTDSVECPEIWGGLL